MSTGTPERSQTLAEVNQSISQSIKLYLMSLTRNNENTNKLVALSMKGHKQGRKKPRSDCPGQVNFALGQAKMEVWWPGGQVKLASAVLLVIIPVKNN